MKSHNDKFFSISKDFLCVLRDDFSIETVNSSLLDLIEYDENEVKGKIFLDFVHEDDKRKIKAELKSLNRNKKEITFQAKILSKKKHLKWIDWSLVLDTKDKVIFCAGRDTTEIKEYLNKLERSTKYLTKLESSNKDLESFAYLASHDLKEPLQHIEMLCDFLDDEYNKENIERIRFSARRARQLIDATLKYASVDSEKYNMKEVDSNELVNSACQDLETIIKKNKAEITRKDLPTIYCEPSQIILLFKNLIANALKYRSNEDPIIAITCKEFLHYLIFCVSDNGVGIDPKYSEVVFEIFKRLHAEKEGEGIGLSICKRIIEKHNGKIWLEPNSEKGSNFYFMIPKKENWCPLEDDEEIKISAHDELPTSPHLF